MVEICNSLLNNVLIFIIIFLKFKKKIFQPNVEVAIRSGDIYAHVIEYFYDVQDFNNAFEYVKKMKEKGIIIAPYLD